ncbi:MAG: methyltransferase domain-containing protein, partial [Desulfamplus sp.]|nr:methyltransferase domain-containing protein [Desulfamplus sp.]
MKMELADNSQAFPGILNKWQTDIHHEIRFWWSWVARHQDEIRHLYKTPIMELPNFLKLELGNKNPSNLSIMELGPGPVPQLGDHFNGCPITYVAVDALADEYAAIFHHYNIRQRFDIIAATGEELTQHFAAESFDVIYSSNALDHTFDPALIIKNMFTLLKPGGVIYLAACRNEGEIENYHGLHQWNFDLYHNRLILWGKTGIN